MVAINKFVLLAVVASVLVGAAYAADESAPVESVGNIRSFGRKIVDGGSSILSHIPIVNRFFGKGDNTPAAPATDDKPVPVEEPTEEQPAAEEKPAAEEPAAEEEAAVEEKAAVEEPAQAEAPVAEEKTPEAPAQEAEAETKSEEPAQSQ